MSNNDKAVDFILELVETQGVAVSTVSDGHVLIFKRQSLQDLLDKNIAQEKMIIFIKRPDFKN